MDCRCAHEGDDRYLRVAAVHCLGQAGQELGGGACNHECRWTRDSPASRKLPKGVASRAASKASLSAVSDDANLITGALAMRAINT